MHPSAALPAVPVKHEFGGHRPAPDFPVVLGQVSEYCFGLLGRSFCVLVIGTVPPQQVYGLPVEIVSLTGDSIILNFMNVQCTAELTDTIIQRTNFGVQLQNFGDFRF